MKVQVPVATIQNKAQTAAKWASRAYRLNEEGASEVADVVTCDLVERATAKRETLPPEGVELDIEHLNAKHLARAALRKIRGGVEQATEVDELERLPGGGREQERLEAADLLRKIMQSVKNKNLEKELSMVVDAADHEKAQKDASGKTVAPKSDAERAALSRARRALTALLVGMGLSVAIAGCARAPAPSPADIGGGRVVLAHQNDRVIEQVVAHQNDRVIEQAVAHQNDRVIEQAVAHQNDRVIEQAVAHQNDRVIEQAVAHQNDRVIEQAVAHQNGARSRSRLA